MNDIIVYICQFLNDINKLNFLSVTTDTNKLKNQVYFDSKISVKGACDLWYGERCRHILISARTLKRFTKLKNIAPSTLPNVNQLTFTNVLGRVSCDWDTILEYLHKHITRDISHIKLGDNLHFRDSGTYIIIDQTKTYTLMFRQKN